VENVLEEDRAAVGRAFEESVQTGTVDHTYRIRVDGRVRWMNARARAHPMPGGGTRWTGYWIDVTEQKELERRLREATEAAERANEAKSDFLAVMSHEIRTPLHGMLGLMELVARTDLAPDQRDMLATAREAGQSLSQIIDDGLDLSRVEAGRLALHPVAASLEAVVLRTCQLHQAVALRKGLRLEWSVDARLGSPLVFDPLRVGQILNNLLANALKFTASGSVRVAAERVAAGEGHERVRLSVTDTGIGVAPEALARIFEPFLQADAGTYAQYGGSGLGLAICRQLARAMGGDVHMRSTRGEGTEIVLEAEFPRACAPGASPPAATPLARVATTAPAAPHPAPSIERAERQGTLVLVVDDHPTNRALLVRQLHALGYAAVGAEDGASALRLWSTRDIGLLLCDCNMPGMTGFELAREIRTREQTARRPRLPILACTARALPGDRERCTLAGMDGCLLKPVGLSQLAQVLDRYLPLPAPTAAPPADERDADEVLAEFAGWHARDLGTLAAAVAAQDFEQARRIAHRMAGAAGVVRAAGLAESCLAVEDAARVGHAPVVEAELEELRRQSRRFEEARRARAP
jgi:signal transduction histidine kinase/CheY-like chemotaxis protein/HPt (histidine-containing phosphotransfer) domain-containing protein